MCVTFNNARLSETTILTGDTVISGEQRRYLHYRNTVAAPFDSPVGVRRSSSRQSEPEVLPEAWRFETPSNGELDFSSFDNCMAFPIFGVPDSIESVETEAIPHAMDDVARAVESQYPVAKGLLSFAITRSSRGAPAVRILKTRFYTSLIAADPSEIIAVLRKNNASERLTSKADVQRQFQRAYGKKAPFGLHLFRNGDTQRGALLLTYVPLPGFEKIYHFPTLDGHGGLDFGADVDVDHVLAIGTDHESGIEVDYSELPRVTAPPPVHACLPKRVVGVKLETAMPNGDVIARVADARNGVWKGLRVAPFLLTSADSPLAGKPLPIEAPQR